MSIYFGNNKIPAKEENPSLKTGVVNGKNSSDQGNNKTFSPAEEEKRPYSIEENRVMM